MKKFLSFFSFIALAVFAMSFVSCSDNGDEPTDPKDVVLDGGMKVSVSESIFEYCDVVATLTHDNQVETFKMDASTQVAGSDKRVVEKKFTHKPGVKNTLKLDFTLTEEGKKKMEAAGEEDEVKFHVTMELTGNHGTQTRDGGYTWNIQHLSEQVEITKTNKLFGLEQ